MRVTSKCLKDQFHQEVKEWFITEDRLNRTNDEMMSILQQVQQQMLKLGEILVKYPDYRYYLPVENNNFILERVNGLLNVRQNNRNLYENLESYYENNKE
jgi:protein gp37